MLLVSSFFISPSSCSAITFHQIFNFIPFISAVNKKYTYFFIFFSYFWENMGFVLHTLQRKQKYQVTNVGVKRKIITFATSKYYWIYEQKSSYFTHVILGLERVYFKVWLCLIKFLFTHILQTWRGPVDNQGRERHGWGPVWLLYLSRKLHSSLSEIVSLVSFRKDGSVSHRINRRL